MKPDWDKLMAEYDDHPSILVGDVDCTAGGESLCQSVGVQGYPTIKYGDPNNLEAYEGGRDLESLSTFAKDKLGPTCGPANLDLCDESKKKEVERYLAMPIDDLAAQVKEKDAEIAKIDKDMEEFVSGLQAEYEAETKKKEDEEKKIKDSGLGMMKRVMASRQTAEKKGTSEL